MKRNLSLIALLVITLCVPPSPAWELPDGGRLKSRWAVDVDPERSIPHPEYPRPQLVRPDWLNLNGVWQLEMATSFKNPPFGQTLAREILVPFPVESALSGIMDEDFSRTHQYMWYRRLFTIPSEWAGRRIQLHFEAVDYEALVFVNGKRIGSHRGGYDAFSFNISDALVAGDNELIVGVFDATNSNDAQARGKQTTRPSRFHYTGSSGIWQTVWLEALPISHVTRLKMLPDVEGRSLKLTVHGLHIQGLQVEATARAQGQPVGTVTGPAHQELSLAVPDPILWSPDHPFLYDLTVTLRQGGRVVDRVTSYFGMRSIAMKKMGSFMRPVLNGRFVFQTGTLDQGFWPDGLYTAPTDEALRFDLQTHKDLGFNMIRKHVKVESKRWFYWADRLGLLVWQDMPHVTAGRRGEHFDAETKAQFELELGEMIREHYNSPSVVQWVVFNEGWGAYEYERLTACARQADPSRIINTESGVTASKARDPICGDVLDNHIYGDVNSYRAKYRAVIEASPNPNRMYAVTEYGGGNMEYRVDGHMWFGNPEKDTKASACTDQSCQDCVTDRILSYLDVFKPLIVDEGLSALAITQYTDLEIERNGLLTYDRQVKKCHFERVRAKNLELIAAGAVVQATADIRPAARFPLFNGRDLDGWVIENGGAFSVANGHLVVNRGTGWLRTQKAYADFVLEMEFRFLEKEANSGIFVRTGATSKQDDNGWPDNGYQVQCKDTITEERALATMIPYGAPPFEHRSNRAALATAYRPAGHWHHYRITCQGETLRVELNGLLITTATGIKNRRGHIGIQAEHGHLAFRKIELHLLD